MLKRETLRKKYITLTIVISRREIRMTTCKTSAYLLLDKKMAEFSE